MLKTPKTIGEAIEQEAKAIIETYRGLEVEIRLHGLKVDPDLAFADAVNKIYIAEKAMAAARKELGL